MFYHSIVEFVFFKEYLREAKRSAIFTQVGEKRGLIYAGAEYYLQPTKLDDIAHEQTIICRQLFAGHVVGFRPMKRKNKMHRMIMWLLW